MLFFRACPRCSGDVAVLEERGERYFSCLQCGFLAYRWPPAPEQSVRRPAA